MVKAALSFLLIAVELTLSGAAFARPQQHTAETGRSIEESAAPPMAFEVNRGQAPAGVDFLSTGSGYSAQIRSASILLQFAQRRNSGSVTSKIARHTIRMALAGGNPAAKGEAQGKLPGYSNYLFGSDRAKWITHVDHYEKVRYDRVYPDIDMLLHGNHERLEEDFILHAHANPRQIRLLFQGATDARLTADGDLEMKADGMPFELQKPRAYQLVAGRRVQVAVNYELDRGVARFRLGPYDARRYLVIDPVLVYSTFFGAVATQIKTMAADNSGVYVAGFTNSTNFPVTEGSLEPDFPGQQSVSNCCAAFVSKLDPTGKTLLFSTYVGGFWPPDRLFVLGLTVDASGDVYLAGQAGSGLPIPSGSQSFQSTLQGTEGAGIIELNSSGTAVLAGTYLSGTAEDYIEGLAIDSSGDVYVSGIATSNDFPVKNAIQATLGSSGKSGFVTEFAPTLASLVYSTYIGANSQVTPNVVAYIAVGDQVPGAVSDLAVDSSGRVYVIGAATSGFPTTAGAYISSCGNSETTCSFLAALAPGGSSFVYSTYVDAGVQQVAVDNSGNAYVAGATSSPFPTASPVPSCSSIGTGAAFFGDVLAEFDSAGALTFATCPVSNADVAGAPVLTLDQSGDAYVADNDAAQSLTLQDPIDANPPASVRPFLSEFLAGSHTLAFSSYVAGPVSFPEMDYGDQINALAVDPAGNVYLAGNSTTPAAVPSSSSFPVYNALQPVLVNTDCTDPAAGCNDTNGFIMKISMSSGPAAALSPAELVFPPTVLASTSEPLATTIYDLGTTALTVSDVSITGDFAIQSNDCGSVSASGGGCAIQVTFTPTALGTRTGTLTITDTSAGSPRQVALIGTGATANLAASPSTLTFSNQAVGSTSTAQTVTLTAGGLAIQGLGIQTTGDFAETNNCGASIAVLGTCSLQVTFTPTVSGSRTGTITITDNAPNSPQTISLSGTGTSSIGLAVASGSSSSATVSAGSSANYSLSLGGQGMSGTASLTCTGAPAGATCNVPASVAVSATSATTVSVTIATTARSATFFRVPNFLGLGPALWLCALTLAGLFIFLQHRGPANRWAQLAFLFVLAPLVLAVCSCAGGSGGGPNPSGTPAGTYRLTVTAQIGNTSQSTNLTLVVQ